MSNKPMPSRAEQRQNFERMLLEDQQPSFTAWHVKEPHLLFAENKRAVDPKAGLAQFGPLDVGQRPVLRIGIIGTGASIDKAKKWVESCQRLIQPPLKLTASGKKKAVDPILYPSFPGISASSSFKCDLQVTHEQVLTEHDLSAAINVLEFPKRVKAAVDVVAARLDVMKNSESAPSVVIVAMPPEVEKACRVGKKKAAPPMTKHQRKALKAIRRSEADGQPYLFDLRPTLGLEESDDEGHDNFRRYLKVRAMEIGLPTQLVWPETFECTTTRQDVATIAWNLVIGLYYKSGGMPWRVTGLEPGTCYVGISFYRDRGPDPSVRTSMAEAFSEHTDGIVLRGEPFRWDDKAPGRGKEPHLDRANAESLLKRVLEVYEKTTRQKPRRIVVHRWVCT